MNWRRRSWLLFLLTSFALLAHATPSAAFSRAIAVSGTSTSAGNCQIIIESFGLIQGANSPLAPFVINVSIPSGSSPSNSAALIRSAVDAALPPDYVVTIPGGQPNVVLIDRTSGTFTMTISNSVPGQTIVETSSGTVLPAVPTWLLGAGLAGFAGVFVLIQWAWLLRRRRGSELPRE